MHSCGDPTGRTVNSASRRQPTETTLNNLVFTTGGFSCGSTLLFTLLRKSQEFHCLYEPLHERLREHRRAGLRVYEHHYHVDDYFAEYGGFHDLERLFDPKLGTSRLALGAHDEAPELYRYLSYLIGMGFTRRPKVLLKFNRASFRLPWLRSAFPHAIVVHIYRDCESQWQSIVRRTQAYLGQSDVGQDRVTFNGMNVATWCDDLAGTYPELGADQCSGGFERFSRLWDLSRREGIAHAHLTIRFEDLTGDFESVASKLWATLGCTSDYRALERWVVRPEEQQPLVPRSNSLGSRIARLGVRLRFELAKRQVRQAEMRPRQQPAPESD